MVPKCEQQKYNMWGGWGERGKLGKRVVSKWRKQVSKVSEETIERHMRYIGR